MEQEEALGKKGRERKAQVQEKLAQNRGAVSIRAKVRKTGRESSCTVP